MQAKNRLCHMVNTFRICLASKHVYTHFYRSTDQRSKTKSVRSREYDAKNIITKQFANLQIQICFPRASYTSFREHVLKNIIDVSREKETIVLQINRTVAVCWYSAPLCPAHHGAHGDLRGSLRICRLKMGSFFDLRTLRTKKEGGILRRRGNFSKKGVLRSKGDSSNNSPFFLHSSKPKIEEPYLRSSNQKIERPSLIFDLRSRRSKNHAIFDLRPRRMGRRSDGRRRGGGQNFFFRRAKNAYLLLSRHEEGIISYLPPSRPKEWTKNSLVLILSSFLSRAPALLSYSEVWILRPIFHLEDRGLLLLLLLSSLNCSYHDDARYVYYYYYSYVYQCIIMVRRSSSALYSPCRCAVRRLASTRLYNFRVLESRGLIRRQANKLFVLSVSQIEKTTVLRSSKKTIIFPHSSYR